MRAPIVLLALAISATVLVAQTRKTLDIYVVDVEGGNATLFVSPSGQSVLIDTGNVAPAAAVRDADRILDAAKDAGITQIDHLITTHWHGDHFGGMAEVAKRRMQVHQRLDRFVELEALDVGGERDLGLLRERRAIPQASNCACQWGSVLLPVTRGGRV